MPSGSRADVATIGSQKAFNQVFVKNLFLLDYLMGSDKKQRIKNGTRKTNWNTKAT